MNVLITGHKGFIGSHLASLFPDAKGYDIAENPADNVLDEYHLIKTLKDNDIDTVIHLAALTSVDESHRFPSKYIKNNIIGSQKAITASLKAGVKKFVYASSAACYDPSSSSYAMSKYIPEVMLDIAKDEMKVISLRFFNIYGKGQNPTYAGVIPIFINGITKNGEITIYGDGDQTRDFIAVEDICMGIKAAVDEDIPSGEVLDLGTGKETSVNELAEILQRLLYKKAKIEYVPARKEVKNSKAETSGATILLDFEPVIGLEEGLRRLIEEK